MSFCWFCLAVAHLNKLVSVEMSCAMRNRPSCYLVTEPSHTMQGNTMSSGRIHVQRSFREFASALNKF